MNFIGLDLHRVHFRHVVYEVHGDVPAPPASIRRSAKAARGSTTSHCCMSAYRIAAIEKIEAVPVANHRLEGRHGSRHQWGGGIFACRDLRFTRGRRGRESLNADVEVDKTPFSIDKRMCWPYARIKANLIP
jgi:hypothetical protein